MSDDAAEPSAQSLARKAARIVTVIISVFSVCILALVGVLLLLSPGTPIPFANEAGRPLPGSISEKIHVSINGVEQGMFIKSKDETKPVLLILHGGPGMPEYFLTEHYPAGLEEYFTVCWWEQRGSGLSYRADIPPETMTVEQLVSDTLAVSNYLRDRFGKEKIYLMAHSWGSFIGSQAAARAPELYYAYIGVAQISYQLKSEWLAYEYMLKRFKDNGNIKMARKLEEAPVTMTGQLPDRYLSVRDEAMHSLGIGTTHDMKSVVTGIFLPVMLNREYTLSEKIAIWRGKAFSRGLLWDAMLGTDLTQQVPELHVPVYFWHGIHDYTVSYTEAKAYFEKLKAPLKGFYTFTQSAHSPLFEEPERMHNLLQDDVLKGTIRHADAS